MRGRREPRPPRFGHAQARMAPTIGPLLPGTVTPTSEGEGRAGEGGGPPVSREKGSERRGAEGEGHGSSRETKVMRIASLGFRGVTG